MSSGLMFIFGGVCGILIHKLAADIMARRKKQLMIKNAGSIIDAIVAKLSELADENSSENEEGSAINDETTIDINNFINDVKNSEFFKKD